MPPPRGLRAPCSRRRRLRVLARDGAHPRAAAGRPRRAPRLDPDARRRAPVGAAVAARGAEARIRCPPSSSTSRTARTTHRSRATSPRHRYFAGHGYASVRVDLRGSGDSEGILRASTCRRSRTTPRTCSPGSRAAVVHRSRRHDRHLVGRLQRPAGRREAPAAARLRAQPLLDRRPLRRRRPLHGRRVLGIDMLSWASTMLAYNARPPDPEIVGEDGWRALWLERLRETPRVDRGLARPPAP